VTVRLHHSPDATPLDPNEIDGLIPAYVTTQGELNEAEQRNILEARAWAMGRKHRSLLTEPFVRDLHRRMFQDVWRWAGQYRSSDKSIGVAKEHIREEVQKLVADVAYWIEHDTYPWIELAARFHHRLVKVHPFANGNGRHSRLLTDLLLEAHGKAAFSWGASLVTGLDASGAARSEYIAALREADRGHLAPLVRFVQR